MFDVETERRLLAALRSKRWSVSWDGEGGKSLERRFAEAFAAYNGTGYCVSVDHGSSALLIALESLGIGPGDEVIVPVLTWVAPATAVLRVGAVPVLADVDPKTGCLTADTIVDAISSQTKAVVVVHLGCTVADLDSIRRVALDVGIFVIEDCSQAHGAVWNGKRVGTLGDLGVYSLGAAKTLAGGEGGAVITNDPDRFRHLQMLRADSRRYPETARLTGCPELVEDGEIMGANYCMSELTASVLLDQLQRLDDHNAVRQQRASELELRLAELGMFDTIPVPPQVTTRGIYEYGVQVKPGVLGALSIDVFADAVSAELNARVYPPRAPLYRSVLLRPQTKRRYAELWEKALARGSLREEYSGADAYRERTLLFHHSMLLGTSEDVRDIAAAFEKIALSFRAV
ncbi:DegT/DnrJ/EryC1/StrS family aminotransferase [Nocardia salmonicida]|uniref:DegT/DnrJ/EryC1/StrS family aminotransferase n=1 Tax=Nocardia salmonicida TaxID=53431 RepID=UPI0037AAF3D5